MSFTNGRVKEVLDICEEEVQGKAIIWATFCDIQQMAKALRDRFGADSVATYYGNTPQEERQEIVKRFKILNLIKNFIPSAILCGAT